MTEYYDGTKLLSLSDINGDKPEIYFCTSNRSAGKTTYFSRLCVKKFLEKGEKFCLIYRFNYELDQISNKFFKDIGELFYPQYTMRDIKLARGLFCMLYIGTKTDAETSPKAFGENCGYAVSLNNADNLKKYSHLFSDTQRMLFDEFQSETGKYAPNEVQKFISVHTSIARGQGKHTRYVPVYMLSNAVSVLNPYYSELDISTRLKHDTKFLKGEGFVLEQGYYETVAQAQKESAFNRAFKKNEYVAYSTENVYLNDSLAFIERPKGKQLYLANLIYENNMYAIRIFPDLGIIYCDDKPDSSCKQNLAITTPDHNINTVMFTTHADLFIILRDNFEKGCFRFKDLKCKEVIFKALSYI